MSKAPQIASGRATGRFDRRCRRDRSRFTLGLFFSGIVCLNPSVGHLVAAEASDAIVIRTAAGTVQFSPANGSIIATTAGSSTGSVWQSGESGLWRAQFADGSTLDATRFHATNTSWAFSHKTAPDTNALTLSYLSTSLTVRIHVAPRPDGLDLNANVTPHHQALLSLDLPGRLRFRPETVTEFVMPHNGGTGVGVAFKRGFFEKQPERMPAGWSAVNAGPAGYRTLYGASLNQREVHDPAVGLEVTAEGRDWLSARVAKRIASAKAVVNRPPGQGQADLVVVNSQNGPYFSASHLGGTGNLWRIGGGVRDDDTPLALEMVTTIAEKLCKEPPASRTRIGLISLASGPERGSWAAVPIADWKKRLNAIARRSRGRIQFVELGSAQSMLDAARQTNFLCILNPYGEGIPVPGDSALPAVVQAIGAYVRAGGHWFEVGGYSFHQALRPVRYLAYNTSYPVAFSDFLHLESTAGSSAIYRIQPRHAPEPWHAAVDRGAIFIPGSLGCGGDDRGGYCDHVFSAYIPAGVQWRAPTVRMTLGTPVREDLARYAAANAITRPLKEKIRPEILSRLKDSVLVYLAGPCRDKIESLGDLPVPTLIHFADYLRGGFDKQYPDHLPPNPKFGTPDEFRALFEKARAMGHLISPYTNPTWWCDNPKGPTFEREGDAPLLRTLDGKARHERYADNDGWTITLWHPAVQRANRETVRQFTRDYPVDVLFQDQCGARGWYYDINPASPTPYAYSEGMISMVDEDSRVVPLATENGWDRVLNYQTMLCGMTWGIVPTEHHPSWVRLFKTTHPPKHWEIFPLAQIIAHDKAILLHHDLGQFITNDQMLSWSLGLGYNLSYRIAATAAAQPGPREWLRWLDRIQKSVCSRYTGEPLGEFTHDRQPLFQTGADARSADDDGIIRATYGPVRISANLGPVPRTVDGRRLAPYGFYASSPNMTAGLLAGGDFSDSPPKTAFVTESSGAGMDLWVYAPAQCTVSVPLPLTGQIQLAFDGASKTTADVTDGYLKLSLSARPENPRVQPPSELKDAAPAQWPGPKPAIGIIDLGPGISPAATEIRPSDWLAAFQCSDLTQKHGVTIKTISSHEQMMAALAAGPRAWFAIINPYGESFPTAGAGRWRETLDAIRNYVNSGGSWWETAAYSFYRSAFRTGDTWGTENCASAGPGALGIPVGDGAVEDPPEPLTVTEVGRAWFGDAVASKVENSTSAVNRGVRPTESMPALVLVSGAESGFIGGYRLNGWGYLWRIGGFNPNPDVVLPVAVATTLHQYTHPPEKPAPSGTSYLWHAKISPAPPAPSCGAK